MNTIRAYGRISADDEANQQLDQAKHLISRWAEYKAPDLSIEWYLGDRGVSGTKPLRNRPDGARLLADLRAGDYLVFTRIDRLARNVADLLETVKLCKERDIRLVATEQDIDTSSAHGEFMITMLGALAQLEAQIVSERVIAAHQQLLRDGRHPFGKLPYGFTTAPNPYGKGLVVRPDPVTSVRLREAIAAITEGASQASQARRLGINQATLVKLLRNKRLYGDTPNGVYDSEAAIISKADWTALQKSLGSPEKTWSRTDTYAAVLRCGACGTRLYYDKNAKNGGNYRCQNRSHDGRVSVNRQFADEVVEEDLLSTFGGRPVWRYVQADDSEQLERIATIDIEMDELLATMRDGTDRVAIAQRLNELEQAKWAIEQEPADDTERIDLLRNPDGSLVRVRDQWPDLDQDERLEMVAKWMRVTVYPASSDVRFKVLDVSPKEELDRIEEVMTAEDFASLKGLTDAATGEPIS